MNLNPEFSLSNLPLRFIPTSYISDNSVINSVIEDVIYHSVKKAKILPIAFPNPLLNSLCPLAKMQKPFIVTKIINSHYQRYDRYLGDLRISESFCVRKTKRNYFTAKSHNFVILGKYSPINSKIGEELAKRTNRCHIDAINLIRNEITRNTLLGKYLYANLAYGKCIPIEIVINLLHEELQDEKYKVHGYVLTGLPLLPSYQLSECLIPFDLKDTPFVERCVDEEQSMDIDEEEHHEEEDNYCEEGEEEEEEEEEEQVVEEECNEELEEEEVVLSKVSSITDRDKRNIEFVTQSKFFLDTNSPPEIVVPISVKRQMKFLQDFGLNPDIIIYMESDTEDIISRFSYVMEEKRDAYVRQYSSYELSLLSIQKYLLHYPRDQVIHIDARLPANEMIKNIMNRLEFLPYKDVYNAKLLYPKGLQSIPYNIREEAAKGNISETLNLICESGIKDYNLTDFGWYRQHHNEHCPVELYKGRIVDGKIEFAVTISGGVFLLANMENTKSFIANPVKYIECRPNYCAAIIGAQNIGKTVLAKFMRYMNSNTALYNFDAHIKDYYRKYKIKDDIWKLSSSSKSTTQKKSSTKTEETEEGKLLWDKVIADTNIVLKNHFEYRKNILKEKIAQWKRTVFPIFDVVLDKVFPQPKRLMMNEAIEEDEEEELDLDEECDTNESENSRDIEIDVRLVDCTKCFGETDEDTKLINLKYVPEEWALKKEYINPTDPRDIQMKHDLVKYMKKVRLAQYRVKYLLRNCILQREFNKYVQGKNEKVKKKTNNEKLYAGIIMDGPPLEIDFWNYLRDSGILPDVVIFLTSKEEELSPNRKESKHHRKDNVFVTNRCSKTTVIESVSSGCSVTKPRKKKPTIIYKDRNLDETLVHARHNLSYDFPHYYIILKEQLSLLNFSTGLNRVHKMKIEKYAKFIIDKFENDLELFEIFPESKIKCSISYNDKVNELKEFLSKNNVIHYETKFSFVNPETNVYNAFADYLGIFRFTPKVIDQEYLIARINEEKRKNRLKLDSIKMNFPALNKKANLIEQKFDKFPKENNPLEFSSNKDGNNDCKENNETDGDDDNGHVNKNPREHMNKKRNRKNIINEKNTINVMNNPRIYLGDILNFLPLGPMKFFCPVTYRDYNMLICGRLKYSVLFFNELNILCSEECLSKYIHNPSKYSSHHYLFQIPKYSIFITGSDKDEKERLISLLLVKLKLNIFRYDEENLKGDFSEIFSVNKKFLNSNFANELKYALDKGNLIINFPNNVEQFKFLIKNHIYPDIILVMNEKEYKIPSKLNRREFEEEENDSYQDSDEDEDDDHDDDDDDNNDDDDDNNDDDDESNDTSSESTKSSHHYSEELIKRRFFFGLTKLQKFCSKNYPEISVHNVKIPCSSLHQEPMDFLYKLPDLRSGSVVISPNKLSFLEEEKLYQSAILYENLINDNIYRKALFHHILILTHEEAEIQLKYGFCRLSNKFKYHCPVDVFDENPVHYYYSLYKDDDDDDIITMSVRQNLNQLGLPLPIGSKEQIERQLTTITSMNDDNDGIGKDFMGKEKPKRILSDTEINQFIIDDAEREQLKKMKLKNTSNIFPCRMRNLLYYVHGRENLYKFYSNPWKYLNNRLLYKWNEPFNIVLIGPRYSGVTTLCKRIALEFNMKIVNYLYLAQMLITKYKWTNLYRRFMDNDCILNDEMMVECIRLIRNKTPVGIVFDNLPINISNLEKLLSNNLHPTLIFILKPSFNVYWKILSSQVLVRDEYEKENNLLLKREETGESKKMRMKVKKTNIVKFLFSKYQLHSNYIENVQSLLNNKETLFMNFKTIENYNDNKWQIWELIKTEVMQTLMSIINYLNNIKVGRCASISNLYLTKTEFYSRLDIVNFYCPLCLSDYHLLVRPRYDYITVNDVFYSDAFQSEYSLPYGYNSMKLHHQYRVPPIFTLSLSVPPIIDKRYPFRENLLQYRKYIYWACTPHINSLLINAMTYLPFRVSLMPPYLPVLVNYYKSALVKYNFHCIVSYKNNLPAHVYHKGSSKYSVYYRGKIYLLCDEHHAIEFLTKPEYYYKECMTFDEEYLDLDIRTAKIDYKNLTPQLLSQALKNLNKVRPKHFQLTIQSSAAIYLGYYLKLSQMKNEDDLVRKIYEENFDTFLNECNLIQDLLTKCKTSLNPFIKRKPKLRPIESVETLFPEPSIAAKGGLKMKVAKAPKKPEPVVYIDEDTLDDEYFDARRVPVPDDRFEYLCDYFKPASKVPAFLNVVDIAGLVKGAAEGHGLGNAFLSHIKACDAIFHLCRAFEDPDVTHVEGEVDPVRDLDIIAEELRLKDEEQLMINLEKLERTVLRGSDKKLKPEYDALVKIKQTLVDEKKQIRFGDWNVHDIEYLNKYLFLTTKPVIYLVNLSEKDFIRKKNKWLIKIKEWVDKNDPGAIIIPFSGQFEQKLADMNEAEKLEYEEENKCKSALDKIIVVGYKALQLEYFFTSGADEVKAWTIQKGTKAPQAAGRIHTDFEKGFIMAEVMHYKDFKEEGTEAAVKAAGKYRQQGRNYVVEDGDIIFFKFNAGAGLKDAKKK